MAATYQLSLYSITATTVDLTVKSLYTGTFYLKAFTNSSLTGLPEVEESYTYATPDSFILHGLQPSTTYYFIAANGAGDSWSESSNTITATTGVAYTLTATYDNPPAAVLTLTSSANLPTSPLYRFKVYSDNAGTTLVTNSGWLSVSGTTDTLSYTVSSINAGVYYVTVESDDPQTFVSLQQVVLTDNTPKTATQSQWEDIVSKIKAKPDSSVLDGRIKTNAGAPTTSTVGTKGQLLEDTTNGKVYVCTAVSGNTYTWAEIGSGGGSNVTKTSDLTNDGSDGTSPYVEADELATVATTGAYSDLSGTPTIPTVNNATLTIQKNGTTVNTFTANASSNVTANITVPTKTSDLTNDSGYTTNTGTITKVQANGTDVASSGTANIPAASTSAYGVTKLSSSTSSTSTSLAATPSAVKSAYDLADSKATITMQTTDPGEGVALAANNFIAVYTA